MRDLAHTNPFEVGLEKIINWDKDFISKDALLKVREAGPEREMVGFVVTDPNEDFYIRSKQYGGPGEPVFIDGEEEEVGPSRSWSTPTSRASTTVTSLPRRTSCTLVTS